MTRIPSPAARLEAAVAAVLGRAGISRSPIHGFAHWASVERNGLFLARSSGADLAVVRLFAYLHDIRRASDGLDPGHGRRGADLARAMRGELELLPDDRFELLCLACEGHTDSLHHEDPTIGTCWDADRLDLGRVGKSPDPALLNTRAARALARSGSLGVLESLPVRAPHPLGPR